jgi:hypothetical protein
MLAKQVPLPSPLSAGSALPIRNSNSNSPLPGEGSLAPSPTNRLRLGRPPVCLAHRPRSLPRKPGEGCLEERLRVEGDCSGNNHSNSSNSSRVKRPELGHLCLGVIPERLVEGCLARPKRNRNRNPRGPDCSVAPR